ncbi:MAG: hypothetical protein ACF8Q5_11130 [Phycisphaerales bacterium JB040]
MEFTRSIASAALACSVLSLTACSEGEPSTTTSASESTPAWILASAPADARSVTDIKASAAEGDEVVLRGRIGGRHEPIGTGSPVFTVIDLGLAHCGQNEGDSCPTPWDYCCETPETITANSATVQIVNTDGGSIGTSPADHGFAPLDEVIVVGSVATRPDDRVLTIRATGVHRVQ